MAAERRGYTITKFEFIVYFLWVFVISSVLYILLAARYTAYSGWLWFALVQSVLAAIVVATTILAPTTTRTLVETTYVATYASSILLGSECLATVGLGILLERYHESSKMFDYYFLVIICLKVSLYIALGLVGRDTATSTSASTKAEPEERYSSLML